MAERITHIRIVAPPAGDAPIEVRRLWVGLTLPLAFPSRDPKKLRFGFGIFTGPRTFLGRLLSLFGSRRIEGYTVRVMDAIAVLEQAHPDGAEWWRHYAPHLVRPHKFFLFHAEGVEEVAGN